MALLPDQQIPLDLDTVYEVQASNLDERSLGVTLWINSGSVDIYASNSETKPTATSQMTLSPSDTGVSGLVKFEVLSRYIAIVQNTGTTTEIVAEGLTAFGGEALA